MKKIIIALVMSVLLVGCSTGNNNATEPIVGMWETVVADAGTEPHMLFLFQPDGTYKWYQSAVDVEDNYYYGQYTVINGTDAMKISGITDKELAAADGNPTPEQVYVINLIHDGVVQGGVDSKKINSEAIPLMLIMNKTGNQLYGMNGNTYSTYTMTKMEQ